MTALWELSATEQSSTLATRACSAVELVRAHLDRISALDGRVKAFTGVFRERALADAELSDQARKRGDCRGLLHGLPVSVKESVDMAGLASTMGVRSRTSLLAARDGGMVQMLREAGAVILGRTNISQYLLFHESSNPLFGRTSNPFSLAHTPGGSSGGEAAAIGTGMSPLGIGTDIGGSIRVPAHFSGIAGLKPTLDRWTNRGSNTSLVGQEAIRGQIGPMARTVGDLVLAMRALDPIRMSAIDARVPPIPFDDPSGIALSGLRVGMYVDDGFVAPSRATVHAIERAADALRARGCTVVPFTPPGIARAIQLYFGAMSSDGGAAIARGLGRDEVDPSLQSLRNLTRIPARGRKLGAKFAGLIGEDKLALILDIIGARSAESFWAITGELRAYRFALTEALDAAAIDAILCPTHATPALPHGMSSNFALAGSPSMLWNAVQFPAGVVPVHTVTPTEIKRDLPRDQLEKHAAKVDASSAGLPVGVQVVARPWRDELVLAVMAAIEAEVRSDAGFPGTPTTPRE